VRNPRKKKDLQKKGSHCITGTLAYNGTGNHVHPSRGKGQQQEAVGTVKRMPKTGKVIEYL